MLVSARGRRVQRVFPGDVREVDGVAAAQFQRAPREVRVAFAARDVQKSAAALVRLVHVAHGFPKRCGWECFFLCHRQTRRRGSRGRARGEGEGPRVRLARETMSGRFASRRFARSSRSPRRLVERASAAVSRSRRNGNCRKRPRGDEGAGATEGTRRGRGGSEHHALRPLMTASQNERVGIASAHETWTRTRK